jgi:two-component system sensor histidine kinase/response regulator
MPSILVIDDEPNNFDVIEALLSEQSNEHNYVVHYASGGQEAIANLEMFNPDLILLDVMMPNMDGIEVCRRLKAKSEWQTVPIIMVTALSSKGDLARCLEVGADDFISKPVSGLELRARVRSMLRIKHQYDRITNLSNLQENTINLLQNNLDQLCGSLVSTLPHELNTPLNGVFGVIDLLLHEHQEMSTEDVQELLEVAQKSAQRLEKLTKRFLQYARIEILTNNAKTTQVKNLRFPISSKILIQDTIREQVESHNRLGDVICDLEDIEITIVHEDFLSIVNELLDNALKFSKPSTPIKLNSYLKNGKFYLTIVDQGRGMTAEQIDQVGAFMQFERDYYEQQGIGLGLKIAKKTTEFYGGEFLISSIYNQSTMVSVELPAM